MSVTLRLDGKVHDLGDGFTVHRVLPHMRQRMVGPFAFLDLMGPVHLPPGRGVDVRPHPHIGLATVTYLFDGEILHRDSLGSEQLIRPGELNWMTAGRGIVHSERSSPAARKAGAAVHGLQLWVALPASHEEVEPSFHHHAAEDIPAVVADGVPLRIVAGSAYGVRSPAPVYSSLFYVEARMPRGTTLELPHDHAERAAYVVSGLITADDLPRGPTTLTVFAPGTARITAREDSHVMLLGGAPLEGPRFMFWNFVSSSQERIDRAKTAWNDGGFPVVPGDPERIPLP